MISMNKRIYSHIFIVALVLTLSACGPTSKRVENHVLMNDISGLVLDRSQEPTLIYKRPHAPTFASYNHFIIDPVRVYAPSLESSQLKDVAQMQRYFRKALITALKESGYKVVTRSTPGTLRIATTISGLHAADSDGVTNIAGMAASIAAGIPGMFSINVGEVTIEAAFINAENNRTDAVVINRSKGSHLMKNKPWSTWADIEATFDIWAEGIAKAVNKAHGRVE